MNRTGAADSARRKLTTRERTLSTRKSFEPPRHPEVDAGIAAVVVRRRRWVIGLWIAVTLLLAPAAARVERDLDVNARVDGSESAYVQEILRTRFRSPFARFAVLVMTGGPAVGTFVGDSVLTRVVREVEKASGVTKTISYLDARDSLFKPAGAGTFVIVGLDPNGDRPDAMVPLLRGATRKLATALRPQYPALRLAGTGDIV